MSQTDPDNFFEKVFQVVKQIPEGRVTSYGAIAAFLGSKGSSRMVGWALNRGNCLERGIPAHRVVNRNGILTGKFHFGGFSTMEELLSSEGIHVENNHILNFKEIFWDPRENL